MIAMNMSYGSYLENTKNGEKYQQMKFKKQRK